MENIDTLYEILDKAFATKCTDEWMELLKEADCICAPVQNYEDLLNDPQARENEYIVEVDHPTQGRILVVGAPWRFSETPVEVAAAYPELGQHTEEVLQELGYSWEDISGLREREAI
jgi:crotonobetainyl-CoA:carnitine CoA-transferase CaiB-like acyl-CoA transferase